MTKKSVQERLQEEVVDREQANTALTWMRVLNAAARPFMTVMFAGAFTFVCVFAWYRGDLSAESYMTAVGPIVATLVGFWFGERAAAAHATGHTDDTEEAAQRTLERMHGEDEK